MCSILRKPKPPFKTRHSPFTHTWYGTSNRHLLHLRQFLCLPPVFPSRSIGWCATTVNIPIKQVNEDVKHISQPSIYLSIQFQSYKTRVKTNHHMPSQLAILGKPSSGCWFQSLWKILVNCDDYSQYMQKHKSRSSHHQPVIHYNPIKSH